VKKSFLLLKRASLATNLIYDIPATLLLNRATLQLIGDDTRRLANDFSALNLRLNSAFEILHKLASGIGNLDLTLRL